MVSGQSHSFPDCQAQGGRLEPGDAGLAGVRPKDDFTLLRPMGWYLSAKLLYVFSSKKENSPSTRSWTGYRASLPQQEDPGTMDAATGKQAVLVSLSGFVAASPNHLATGLDSAVHKVENTHWRKETKYNQANGEIVLLINPSDKEQSQTLSL